MSKKSFFRLGIIQGDPCVGDIAGNLLLAKQALHKAQAKNVDLLLFSELFLSGYSPQDMVLKPAFYEACEKAATELAKDTAQAKTALLIGLPLLRDGVCRNAVILMENGKIIGERYKTDLPNYSEFDEKRVFVAGTGAKATTKPLPWRDMLLGVPICEDIWKDSSCCQKLAEKGAEFILVTNASPYGTGKSAKRLQMAKEQVKHSGLPLAYANQFGGQDGLVFDGGSFILDSGGRLVCRLPDFAEDLALTDWEKSGNVWKPLKGGEKHAVLPNDEADYTACMIGLRDYMAKNGFQKALLGLSGGIDSALCAALAADAIGAENLTAIMLPYHYTAEESLHDAEQCAKNIGCIYETLPITAAVEAAAGSLAPLLENGCNLKQIAAKAQKGENFLWLENIQSRMRGLFLMAVSNKSGALLLTTGNKSEIAVGFATLYGDMNGGFNPIKDVYKMHVYRLSKWRNTHVPKIGKGSSGIVIPPRILQKAPSAELYEGQYDEDRLPPYPVLDAVLHGLIEEEQDCAALIAHGYPQDIVEQVERLLYIAEYKRNQAAPGVKLSDKAFGTNRRYPITNRFRTAAD